MLQSKALRVFGCIGLFLFFVVMTFPFQNLSGMIFGNIYRSTGILIVSEDMSPTFFGWPGVSLHNVTVTFPVGDGQLELRAEKVVARVGIGGIFPPAPAISLTMTKLKGGGDLYLRVVPGKTWMKAIVEAEKLNMRQLAIPGLAEPIPGILDMNADVLIDRADATKSSGKAELTIAGLRIPPIAPMPGISLPALKMGDLKTKFAIRSGAAEITQFAIGGKDSDIQGTAVGDLRLQPNFLASFLNLTLRLQLTERYRQDPQSATVVSFFDTFRTDTPGTYGMKWSATLLDMTTNVMSAIPTKAN